MRVSPRPFAVSLHHYFGKLALGFVALWLVLQPLAAPAHADNPISGFVSALKDGQDAGRVLAAQYGLRQSIQARKISQQYFDATDLAAERVVNQLSAKHPNSETFTWMENRMRDSILSDPADHGGDLQLAAALIYAEATREVANPGKTGQNGRETTRPGQSQIPAEPPLSTQPKNLTPQPRRTSPSSTGMPVMPILVVVVGGAAGLIWFLRRRRKPLAVSYVQVKSPLPGEPSQSEPTSHS